MARAGMSVLIAALRALTNAGAADYTIGATTYWSDDQLQDMLDAQRTTASERLTAHPQIETGILMTRRYTFAARDVEQAASGADAWQIVDADGNEPDPLDYTVQYAAREILFSSDQGDVEYTLRRRAYGLKRAAAAVWEQKAAHAAARFDIKTDNHELTRSQLRTAALAMAAQLRAEAEAEEMADGPRHVRFVRGDVW